MSRSGLTGVKVGDTLVVRMTWEREAHERPVTKVGRRWIHTRGGYKFDIETGQSESMHGYALTVQEYNDNMKRDHCRDYLLKRGISFTHGLRVDVLRVYEALLPLFEKEEP